ncbi:MAG: hypothetical protein DDT40_01747 [candidate division WS2 bacterium]|nr:hypothetical protein [Candidatus Psychracetigena formicireducens]
MGRGRSRGAGRTHNHVREGRAESRRNDEDPGTAGRARDHGARVSGIGCAGRTHRTDRGYGKGGGDGRRSTRYLFGPVDHPQGVGHGRHHRGVPAAIACPHDVGNRARHPGGQLVRRLGKRGRRARRSDEAPCGPVQGVDGHLDRIPRGYGEDHRYHPEVFGDLRQAASRHRSPHAGVQGPGDRVRPDLSRREVGDRRLWAPQGNPARREGPHRRHRGHGRGVCRGRERRNRAGRGDGDDDGDHGPRGRGPGGTESGIARPAGSGGTDRPGDSRDRRHRRGLESVPRRDRQVGGRTRTAGRGDGAESQRTCGSGRCPCPGAGVARNRPGRGTLGPDQPGGAGRGGPCQRSDKREHVVCGVPTEPGAGTGRGDRVRDHGGHARDRRAERVGETGELQSPACHIGAAF